MVVIDPTISYAGVPEPLDLNAVEMERVLNARKSRFERVIYYRQPAEVLTSKGLEAYPQAHWITWGDSQPAKRIGMMSMGWEPLPQFGRITQSGPNAWKLILTHARGPEQFPVAQVISNRWFWPDRLPGEMRNTKIRFPQFDAWLRSGNILDIYWCPECTRREFLEPFHLARHLTNTHGYDRAALIALGDKMGWDFNKALTRIMTASKISAVDIPEVEIDEEPLAEIFPHLHEVRPESTAHFIGSEAVPEPVSSAIDERLVAVLAGFEQMQAAFARLESLEARLNALGAKPKRQLSEDARQRARDNLARARQLKAERSISAVADSSP